MKSRKCTIEGCNGYVFSKGKCKYHSAVEAIKNPSKRLQIYYELRDAYLNEHNTCEFVGCNSQEVTLHHKAGRNGNNLYKHFKALCLEHHRYVEDNPAWAIENGYSLKRHIIQTTEPPEYGC